MFSPISSVLALLLAISFGGFGPSSAKFGPSQFGPGPAVHPHDIVPFYPWWPHNPHRPSSAIVTPSEHFAKCCAEIGFDEATVKDICVYPPDPLPSMEVRKEVAAKFDQYIGCYAGHKDNEKCCYSLGVRGGDFDICRDFCNGLHPNHSEPLQQYYVCREKEHAISTCNQLAWKAQSFWQQIASLVPKSSEETEENSEERSTSLEGINSDSAEEGAASSQQQAEEEESAQEEEEEE